jgi:formylglycine-generating enzyme required for sulfatase activity
VATALLAASFASARGSALEIDWVTIGDPGNPPDDTVANSRLCVGGESGFGSVAERYRIGRTEITRGQYAEFLNAVASAADPNGLYDIRMVDGGAGISRTADPPYVYAVAPGNQDLPIGAVGYYDTLRFANWLHNGQPSGPQSDATTEEGAYALHGSNPTPLTREPDALFFLPSEDEWYKAAFYDPSLGAYRLFPTHSDSPPTLGPPTNAPNSANIGCCTSGVGCNVVEAVCDVTDVGSYPASASPLGTLDQAGNLWEWTEDLFEPEPNVDPTLSCPFWYALTRGGAWNRGQNDPRSTVRTPTALDVCCSAGFRMASRVPRRRCGLGFELALPLALLGRIRGRRLRRPRSPAAWPRDLPGI